MENSYRIDWCSIQFNDIAVSLKRGPFGSTLKKEFFVPKGYKVYEQQNAIKDNHLLGDYYIDERKYKELEAFSIRPGDYIVSCSGTIGKISRLPGDTAYGIINQALLRIRIDERIIAHRFFQYLFKSMYLQSKILVDSRGTGMNNLAGVKELRIVNLFLPPLPEQRAIVSKIEQLFSDLDNGIENFKKAQEQLKMYRQAVLKMAFEGELTKKWREGQSGLPSADELLQLVKDERENHCRKQMDEWKSAVKDWDDGGKEGKKPTKLKKSKELPPLTEKELAELPELPEGKFWIKLGMLTLNVEYGTSSKSMKKGKIPVLRMGNIQNNRFVWDDLAYTDDEDEINKYLLKKGDVLFNRTNSPELVGKTAIYNGEKTAIFAGYLIRINQIHNLVNPNYLNYFLNSHTAKVHGNTVKTDGVNQSNINGEKLKNYPFPYFSLLEQHQIVGEIETRLSICDNMEATIAESLQKAESLRQSILKKAFEGKLLNERELKEVRNSPDWEPAGKLLERIKAEKTNIEVKNKGKK